LLQHTEITLLIQKDQQLLANRQQRHRRVWTETGLTGQPEYQAGALHAHQRLGATRGLGIAEPGYLSAEGAEPIGVLLAELKLSAKTPLKRQT
jgi:hypothetical protein